MERWVKRLSVAAMAGMFLVLVMGATVTNTGSGEGCGRSWPLCHGEFIPTYAVSTAIEFSHRAVTGIEGFLIAAVAIGAFVYRRQRRETWVLVGLMVGSLFLQAGMGAWAVMYPQADAVLATHFGISLICFAATFLMMRLLYEPAERTERLVADVPSGYRWLAWGTLIGVTIVAYLGAYMRHSGNELACYEWPSCNGQVFPGFGGPEGIAFSHRLAATIAGLMVAGLVAWSYRFRARYPEIFGFNVAALVLICLQAAAGGAVVLSRLDLGSTLAHAGLMALLFVCLADVCRAVLPLRQPAPSRLQVPQGATATVR